jgi:[ribosomal protein S18]-alanine N-acetyltransferase
LSVDIVFEPMTAADLPQVMEIERLVFPSPWTPGLFLHELKIPFSRVRVARRPNGGAVAGYVCWWVVGDEAHILNLAVHPDCRRAGLGRALVELVVGDARHSDAATVSLEVRRGNHEAMHLYRSLRFAECGVRRNYYGRGEDAVIMTLRLCDAASAPAS